jgi:predicted DNA-binding helix-hairpin-helix protein
MLLADRLSLNLEAPHHKALSKLAPNKDFQSDLINPLTQIHKYRQTLSPARAWKGRWPSTTTQFVVGAAGETDQELLSATQQLHQKAGIQRAYYSSFSPFESTPLANLPPSPPLREFRLYQAFFLTRDYGFHPSEFTYDSSGNLPLNMDPKIFWAENNLKGNPLEINTAPPTALLRIPGLGPTRVKQILKLREKEKLNSSHSLLKMKLLSPKSLPYLLINGKQPPLQAELL